MFIDPLTNEPDPSAMNKRKTRSDAKRDREEKKPDDNQPKGVKGAKKEAKPDALDELIDQVDWLVLTSLR